ncbi:Uncharacterised protein [Mycobacterium tuberculosis]|nr:Uncharacterised protein [Mycobacterium tuberculosis]
MWFMQEVQGLMEFLRQQLIFLNIPQLHSLKKVQRLLYSPAFQQLPVLKVQQI